MPATAPIDMTPLDLDAAATTPLVAPARAAMEPFLEPGRHIGNPSGSHALARAAVRALDEAREVAAGVPGCRPGELVFTSGGTEADVQAVSGGLPPRSGVPLCSAVEHPAVREPTLALGGATVAVDRLGRVDLDTLADVLGLPGPPVGVVSVMAANNELGTRNDIDAVAEVVRRVAPGSLLHTDAVQAAAWLDLAQVAGTADLVSVSAHKLGGPAGVGALIVREGTPLAPLLRGGPQERGRRAGTPALAGIVGFAAALADGAGRHAERAAAVGARRDRLAEAATALAGVTETVGPEVRAALGEPADRSHLLPGHCHLMIDDVVAEELLLVLEQEGVCASAGASCASGSLEVSPVLGAIGVTVGAPLRLSLGPDTTDAEVDAAVAALGRALDRLRSLETGSRR